MKVRRYFGKDAQEAMLKVKMDLGSEAIILNTRRVKGKGILSFFKKPIIEVLAAVDEYQSTSSKKDSIDGNQSLAQLAASSDNINDHSNDKIHILENKIVNIEDMLRNIYDNVSTKTQTLEKPLKIEDKDTISISEFFYNSLIRNDIEPEFALKIINNFKTAFENNKSVSENTSKLHKFLVKLLDKPEVIQLRKDGKPTVIIFVGPTGVGKTTTLAKIAANFALNYKKKVGLITTDTYRIAAVEQLKTYAEILGLPLSVVYSPNEITETISQYKDMDMVLIDTAGRSHSNKAQLKEMKSWLDLTKADEIYLVLSMTNSNRNCRELLKNYSFLDDYKIIFTKYDESSSVGLILNVKLSTGKKLSYITTGQNVPDDIEVVDIDKISKKILGSLS